jgi:hypothetical protein
MSLNHHSICRLPICIFQVPRIIFHLNQPIAGRPQQIIVEIRQICIHLWKPLVDQAHLIIRKATPVIVRQKHGPERGQIMIPSQAKQWLVQHPWSFIIWFLLMAIGQIQNLRFKTNNHPEQVREYETTHHFHRECVKPINRQIDIHQKNRYGQINNFRHKVQTLFASNEKEAADLDD